MKHIFQKHEIQFIAWTSGIFLATVTFLVVFGFIPSEFQVSGGETFEQRTRTAVREIFEGKSTTTIKPATSNTSNTSTKTTNVAGTNNVPVNTTTNTNTGTSIKAEEPIRIKIPAISVDATIINPKSTSFEVLDTALTKGAVRYPGSGLPGSGNMFIFGHSTGFSVVQNQAYKVFNKLKNLNKGDLITIQGTAANYEYRVTSVKKVDKSSALVTFDTSKNMLTLSTCDSFGREEDRFVVEAEFVAATLK